MIKKKIFVLSFIFLLLSVIMAEAKVPGNTAADEVLQNDIAKMIDNIQQSLAPECKYAIIDTRRIEVTNDSNGRLTVSEEWVVLSCAKEIIYPVLLQEDPEGGVNFTVSTPDMKFFNNITKIEG